MDLRQFYLDNINDQEYHYKFYETIVETEQVFDIIDEEEAIEKLKKLLQQEVFLETVEKK